MSEDISNFVEMPWPRTTHAAIMPIFLPFQGCLRRCTFCAQDKQSGVSIFNGPDALKKQLDNCLQHLLLRQQTGKPPIEIGFYGATFTGLNADAWHMCLDFAANAIGHNLVTKFRCSTRPDSLAKYRLEQLARAGCHLVELGVQSFCDDALAATGRDYDSQVCVEACAALRDFGFDIGIHLMPGMPCVNADIFLKDVDLAILHGVKCLRLHPCLVLQGTWLEKMWLKGEFIPWNIDETVINLAQALLKTQSAGVTVIRQGLAPEETLEDAVLAGPRHPSLGSMAMGEALFMAVCNMFSNCPKLKIHSKVKALYVPKSSQGYFWGWKNSMRKKWQQFGIQRENLFYWDKDSISLCLER